MLRLGGVAARGVELDRPENVSSSVPAIAVRTVSGSRLCARVKASAKTRTTAADWTAWEGGSYLMGPLELAERLIVHGRTKFRAFPVSRNRAETASARANRH
jgi:hypothetical protein